MKTESAWYLITIRLSKDCVGTIQMYAKRLSETESACVDRGLAWATRHSRKTLHALTEKHEPVEDWKLCDRLDRVAERCIKLP